MSTAVVVERGLEVDGVLVSWEYVGSAEVITGVTGATVLVLKLIGSDKRRVQLEPVSEEVMLAVQTHLLQLHGADPEGLQSEVPYSFRSHAGSPDTQVLRVQANWGGNVSLDDGRQFFRALWTGLKSGRNPAEVFQLEGGREELVNLTPHRLESPAGSWLWSELMGVRREDRTLLLVDSKGDVSRWPQITVLRGEDLDWLVDHLNERIAEWKGEDAERIRQEAAQFDSAMRRIEEGS